jgi:hypothetical protein
MLENLIHGFAQVFEPASLLFIFFGVFGVSSAA